MPLSRRSLLRLGSFIPPLALLGTLKPAQSPAAAVSAATVTDGFPGHSPEMIRETVLVAHFNEKRLRELVDAHPSLSRAAWDWGFGDWEDALGAASHMGNRSIAELLISKGARPSLFSAAMLGELDVVKSFLAAHPGAHRIFGPHSISLLAHARMGGPAARPVLDFLQSLGEVESPPAALTPEDISILVGTYPFGSSPSQQLEIDANARIYAGNKMYTYAPQLNFTRKGTMPRPLFHLGDRVFYPAGAPAVRIRFSMEGSATTITVSDPGPILTARRSTS